MTVLAVITLLGIFALIAVGVRRHDGSGAGWPKLAAAIAVVAALLTWGARRHEASRHQEATMALAVASDTRPFQLRMRTPREHERLLEQRAGGRRPDVMHTRIADGEGFEVYPDGMIFHYSQGNRELFRDPGLAVGRIRSGEFKVRPMSQREHDLLRKYRLAATQPDAEIDYYGVQQVEVYPDGMKIEVGDGQRALRDPGAFPTSDALVEVRLQERQPTAQLQRVDSTRTIEIYPTGPDVLFDMRTGQRSLVHLNRPGPYELMGQGAVVRPRSDRATFVGLLTLFVLTALVVVVARRRRRKQHGSGLGWAAIGLVLLFAAGACLLLVRTERSRQETWARRVDLSGMGQDTSWEGAYEPLHAPTIQLDDDREPAGLAEPSEPTEPVAEPSESASPPQSVPEVEDPASHEEEPAKPEPPLAEEQLADAESNSAADDSVAADLVEAEKAKSEVTEREKKEDEAVAAAEKDESRDDTNASSDADSPLEKEETAVKERPDAASAGRETYAVEAAARGAEPLAAVEAAERDSSNLLAAELQNAFQDLPQWQSEASSEAGRQKPSWVQKPPKRVGETVERVVKSGPFLTVDECFADIGPKLYAQAQQRTKTLVQEAYGLDSPYMGRLNLGTTEILRQICHEQFVETREFSVGDMKQLYVLMRFDREADQFLLQRWTDANRFHRLMVVAVGFGLLLGTLALVYGLLKLDTLTRGYYTKRLFIGVPAAIMLVFFLAVALS